MLRHGAGILLIFDQQVDAPRRASPTPCNFFPSKYLQDRGRHVAPISIPSRFHHGSRRTESGEPQPPRSPPPDPSAYREPTALYSSPGSTSR